MEPIKIGSTVPAEKVHYIIEKFPLKKKIDINYEDYNDKYIYSLSLNKRKTNEEIALYNILADFIQSIILDFYSRELISERVNKVIKEIGGLDHYNIKEKVYEVLIDDKEFVREKSMLNHELLSYLIENNILIIDGYLTFRPKTFNYLIDKAIDKVIIEIQLEKEYDEFIYMLQTFVDSQYSKIDLVNVVIKNDRFQLLDADNNKINNDYIEIILEDLFDDDINQSDILLSSLLAVSPLNIVIHIEEGKENELIEVLKKIFRNRIKICDGCSLCYMHDIERKIDR